MKKLFLPVFLMMAIATVQAQTADDIIAKYFENTGGLAKWQALQGVKMTAKLSQMGMEIPLTMIQMRDGRQATVVNFQGKEIKQGVFDGTTLWSHNFMTMKAEKSDSEATENFKLQTADFPDPFLDYQKKGYKVELLGKETVEGTECFKIKLTKKPIKVDGKPQDNISFYFFDANDYVPIMMESEITSGQGKGMISQLKMSDYTEVSGILFPFTMTQGIKGGPGQPITISAIELNPKVEASVFALPADK
ncbi:MAG: outer membrane lipoprotein-sorting protein [Bacteroidota bacterium]